MAKFYGSYACEITSVLDSGRVLCKCRAANISAIPVRVLQPAQHNDGSGGFYYWPRVGDIGNVMFQDGELTQGVMFGMSVKDGTSLCGSAEYVIQGRSGIYISVTDDGFHTKGITFDRKNDATISLNEEDATTHIKSAKKITIKASGNITITAKNFAVTGSSSTTLKASDGGHQIELKGRNHVKISGDIKAMTSWSKVILAKGAGSASSINITQGTVKIGPSSVAISAGKVSCTGATAGIAIEGGPLTIASPSVYLQT